MTDNVNHPSHYARFRFECEPKDFTKHLPHPLASAVEYFIRSPHKANELEDLQKAAWWLREFISTDAFWDLEACDEPAHQVMANTNPSASKYLAAAWGLVSQCSDIQYLFMAEKDPLLIQQYGTKYLLRIIKTRIEKLQSNVNKENEQ